MSVVQSYVVKSRVHHALKGIPPKGQMGDPDFVPGKPGKMVKLEAGEVCPPELVAELKGLDVLMPKGASMKDPNFGRGVSVGEAGEVGKYEELPAKDGEDEEKKPPVGYAKAKKGK